jgi:uncharacterized membrane protein
MSEPNVPPPPSYTPPPPPGGTMPPPSGSASQNRGLMLALAYLGPLAIIPLVAEKDDKEVQWHAKHGLVIFVVEIVLFIVLGFLIHIPFFGCLIALGFPLLGLACFILAIYMILQAQKGQRVMIPGISEFADRF